MFSVCETHVIYVTAKIEDPCSDVFTPGQIVIKYSVEILKQDILRPFVKNLCKVLIFSSKPTKFRK